MGTPANSSNIGGTAARILLEIGAVAFRSDDPFVHTSGRKSPSYIDCRRIISFPQARTRLTALAIETIRANIGYDRIDCVAGGETAGIPFAAWIADTLTLPMVYVRKQPKGFGRMAQIEGDLPEGSRVLLVEDLNTDGGSKRVFVDALRAAGAKVDHVLVVFHYGIFEASDANMREMAVNLSFLATWGDILQAARDGAYFDTATLDIVQAYLDDPLGWSP